MMDGAGKSDPGVWDGSVRHFSPSSYTAALLRVVELATIRRSFRRAIEIGVGSGVVSSVIAESGVERIWATDIEPDALRAAETLFDRLGLSSHLTLTHSDIWDTVNDTGFDLVIANLPHYPLELPPEPARLRTWSGGGRRLIDRFLHGLPGRLSGDGRVYMTHLDLIGLEQTFDIIRSLGLEAHSAFVWTVCDTNDRIEAILGDRQQTNLCSTLRRYGDYWFVDARILEVRWGGKSPLVRND